jgi:hypothetical protein
VNLGEARRTRDGSGGPQETIGYSIKRRLLGPPMVNEQLQVERLSRPLALGVLSCDGISSANYGSELLLHELLPFFGLTAFTLLLTIRPISKTSDSRAKRCQRRNASPSGKSPVGSPVLAATTRAKRSGLAATSRSPIRPPQSWPTSVMPARPSRSKITGTRDEAASGPGWSARRSRSVIPCERGGGLPQSSAGSGVGRLRP